MYRRSIIYLSTFILVLFLMQYQLEDKSTVLAYLPMELSEDINTKDSKHYKTVQIEEVESIMFNEIYEGKTSLVISYDIVANEMRNISISVRPYKELDRSNLESGISLSKLEGTPYVRIANEEVSMGVGTKDFIIPSEIYDLLPNPLNQLEMYHRLGEIVIQSSKEGRNSNFELDLDDLGLTNQDKNKIKYTSSKYATLELVANYEMSLHFIIANNSIVELNSRTVTLEEDRENLALLIHIPVKLHYTVND